MVRKSWEQIKNTGKVRLFKSHRTEYPDGGRSIRHLLRERGGPGEQEDELEEERPCAEHPRQCADHQMGGPKICHQFLLMQGGTCTSQWVLRRNVPTRQKEEMGAEMVYAFDGQLTYHRLI